MEIKDTNPKDALGIRKVPIHAVSMNVLSEVGLAMMEGGRKYGTHNYRAMGVRASVQIDAVWRHLFVQWWEGEDTDEPSGLSHISKAIACLTVLRDSMLEGNLEDDRPIRLPGNHLATIERLNEKAGKIIDSIPDCKLPFVEVNRTGLKPELESVSRGCVTCDHAKVPYHKPPCKGCFDVSKPILYPNWEEKNE